MFDPSIYFYKQHYAELLRDTPSKAEAFADEIIDHMVDQSRDFNEPLCLAYAFDLCIAFDRLQQAARLVKLFPAYMSDDKFTRVIEISLAEKTPFAKGCLFYTDSESEKARNDLLTNLIKIYPDSAVVQYVYAFVSYHMNKSIVLAVHHALRALDLMRCQSNADTVLFARICILTSLMFASEQVNSPDDALPLRELYTKVLDTLSPETLKRLDTHSALGIFDLFNTITERYSLSKGCEYVDVIMETAKSEGDEVSYAQACAVKAIVCLRQKQFDEAHIWVKKASLIYDDPRFTKIEADILFDVGRYKDAIALYRKANIVFLSGRNAFDSFKDSARDSFLIPRFELCKLAAEAHKKHIQAAIRINDYEEAQLQIDIASRHYPSAFDWTVFIDHILDAELAEEQIAAVERDYEACLSQYGNLKSCIRNFAMQLQTAQDRFADLDLDISDNWDRFFMELQSVANVMVKEARRAQENQQLYSKIESYIRNTYPKMERDAMEGLITADFLYQAYTNETPIDYAPIVVGFAKALEVQIKANKGYPSDNIITFGQLIFELKERIEEDVFDRLCRLNEFRRDAAHATTLDKASASTVRDLVFGVPGRKKKGLLVVFLSN